MESATTEKELLTEIQKIRIKRSKDLKQSLKKIKAVWVYGTLLKKSKTYFETHKQDGIFTEQEIELLINAGLIKA